MNFQFPAFMLPEPERGYTYVLNHLLSDLEQHEERFAAALDLFDFCGMQISAVGDHVRDNMDLLFSAADTRPRFASWMRIAATDGALTIYNVVRTAHQINTTVNHCPTIKPFVTQGNFNKALNEFNKVFPFAKESRTAAAHASADLHGTPKERAKNSYTGPYDQHGIRMSDGAERNVIRAISGRHIIDTIEGEIVSFEMSEASLQALHDLRRVYEATLASAKEASSESFERSFEAQGFKPNA